MEERQNFSLLNHNTFGIDAKCEYFVDFQKAEEVGAFFQTHNLQDTPLLIIGKGSNLLLTKDFTGWVLHSSIKGKQLIADKDSSQDIYLRCGSGETWDDIISYCIEHNWYGAENLSLIPGDVGASAVQNIGAYGAEIKDFISEVEAIEIATGKLVKFSNDDCRYGYRDSRFKHEWKNRYFITHVTYKFSKSFKPNTGYGNIKSSLQEQGICTPTPTQLRNTIIEIRRNKLPDPSIEGNAGSFFMNPIVENEVFQNLLATYPQMPHYTIDEHHTKIPAGWLIEQCGWKGKSLGRAGVHDKQALVLVNRGGANGQEIVTLYKTIINDVKKKFGIEIHPEVNVK